MFLGVFSHRWYGNISVIQVRREKIVHIKCCNTAPSFTITTSICPLSADVFRGRRSDCSLQHRLCIMADKSVFKCVYEWHMLVEMESHYRINQSQYRVEGLNVHFAFFPSSWSYLTHNHLNLMNAILWNLRYCNYTNYSKHLICVNITWLT